MKKYIVLFCLSFLVYLAHFVIVKHGIYGDGNGYYSLAYTLFVNHNLNLGPIYNHLSHFPGASYNFSRVFWNIDPLPSGILGCPWLIGTALSWMPAFILPLPTFSIFYEVLIGMVGIFYMIAGLYFIERTLKIYYSEEISQLVVYCIYFGSFIFYYTSLEPALSHQPSFFLISLLLYLVLSTRFFSHDKLLYLGICMGLLFIIRMNDLFFLAPITLYVLMKNKKGSQGRITALLILLCGIGIGIVPQLLLQYKMYGNVLYNPYIQGGKWSFGAPSIVGVGNILFYLRGGFLTVSPLYVFSLIGVYRQAIQHGQLINIFKLTAVIFVTYLVFISSWYIYPPAGFGNRFFIQTVPFLALGLGSYLSQGVINKGIFFIGSIIWNVSMLALFLAKI